MVTLFWWGEYFQLSDCYTKRAREAVTLARGIEVMGSFPATAIFKRPSFLKIAQYKDIVLRQKYALPNNFNPIKAF